MSSTRGIHPAYRLGRAAVLAACLLAACCCTARPLLAQNPFPNRVKSPSLDGGVEWINTSGPVDLKDLRGKFVILDFWTYCCINCMHILPELKKLEHAHPDELVVIGVHSGKFATERDSQNIREAVLRYEIEHPVINDAHHQLWNKFEVESWPSLRVIDPEGYVVAQSSGEVDFETLDRELRKVLPFYRGRGLLDPTPIHFERESNKAPDTPLRFPGKILADERSDRLYISDSNHNRIVVARLDGTLVEVIGSGQIGRANGAYDKASFDHPQGTALAGDFLYVADTENHLIRRVDLRRKTVETIAGTGKQGHGWPPTEAPAKTPLNSPWALRAEKNNLYIAMAGPHQIWRMPLGRPSTIAPFAGNGREDIVDGLHLPSQPFALDAASFAQPSGLASDGKVLFVADSEGSSIRAVPLEMNRPVYTLVGTSQLPQGRLFTFGDQDGVGPLARLQHALDVLYQDGVLYVADTYNNKIKTINPKTLLCETLAGTGKPGKSDSPAQFDEPAGLAYAAGNLYVADTNNHRIRTINLKDGDEVATLEIVGLKAPVAAKPDRPASFPGATKVSIPAAKVKPVDGKVSLQVAIELPAGFKLTPDVPVSYLVEAAGDGPITADALGKVTDVQQKKPTFSIDLPASDKQGEQTVTISLAFYICTTGSEGVCRPASVIWTVPLNVASDNTETSVKLPFKVAK